MRPQPERAEHTERGLDLERLWKDLDEEAPGPVRALPRPPRDDAKSKPRTKNRKAS